MGEENIVISNILKQNILSTHTNPNRSTREGRIGRHSRTGDRQTNTKCTEEILNRSTEGYYL